MKTEKQVKFNKSLFILGYMGTGKTTISRLLTESLGIAMIDIDAEIAKEQGISINEIFTKYGEEYFRDLETSMIERLAAGPETIISCGGGVPLRQRNRDIIKAEGIAVVLTASPKNIYERIKNDNQRPLLKGNMSVEYIADMLEKRREAYASVAHHTIGTDGKTPEEICAEILELCRFEIEDERYE